MVASTTPHSSGRGKSPSTFHNHFVQGETNMHPEYYRWASKALKISASLRQEANSPEALSKAYEPYRQEALDLADRLETEVKAIILATQIGA